MTFEKLFETAISNIDSGKTFAGRTAAIDEVTRQLQTLMQNEITDTGWTTCYVYNSYGRSEDPHIKVYAHDVNRSLDFKVRLKKAGTTHSFWGDTTYYKPVAACLVHDDLMKNNITDYLTELYNADAQIKLNIEKENTEKAIKADHAELITRIRTAVEEFNALPADVRYLFRYDIPTPSYY